MVRILPVLAIARTLLLYAVLFVVVDALHVASFSLRGYKVTVVPMLVHTFCFWGLGLTSGYALAFRGVPEAGVALISTDGRSGFSGCSQRRFPPHWPAC